MFLQNKLTRADWTAAGSQSCTQKAEQHPQGQQLTFCSGGVGGMMLAASGWKPGSASGRHWGCGCWRETACSCDSFQQCCWSCSGLELLRALTSRWGEQQPTEACLQGFALEAYDNYRQLSCFLTSFSLSCTFLTSLYVACFVFPTMLNILAGLLK